jgi:hypothetical protein
MEAAMATRSRKKKLLNLATSTLFTTAADMAVNLATSG